MPYLTETIATLREMLAVRPLDRPQYRAALKKAADALEAAGPVIEPFAGAADAYDPDEGDDHQDAWDTMFTIGDLRAARDWKRKHATEGSSNG